MTLNAPSSIPDVSTASRTKPSVAPSITMPDELAAAASRLASRATSGEISAVAADTISPVWIPTPRRTSKPSTPGGRATSSSAAATARTASSSCTCGCPNTATTSIPSSASTVAPRAASVARAFSTIFGTVTGIASGSGDDPSARLIDTSTARTLTILRVGSPATGGSGGGSDRSPPLGSRSIEGSDARMALASSTKRGLGSRPNSSLRRARPAWNASIASACRPVRYRASIRSARSRSRAGCSSTSARSSATSSACRPDARSATSLSSIVMRRSSASRSISARAKSS